MEHFDASFHDGEWESLCGMFTFETDLERFTAPEILGQCSSPDEGSSDPSHPSSIVGITENLFYSPSDSGTSFHPYHTSLESQHFFNGFNQSTLKNDASMCMDIAGIAQKHIGFPYVHMLPEDTPQEVDRVNPTKEIQLKRKFDMTNGIDLSRNTKKKHRVQKDAEQSGKRILKLKKNQKVTMESNNENSNAGSDGQTLSSYGSDDDLASRETNAIGNLTKKTRASRGTATDPQSLYARKRRERINERLKILQSLVPNGLKVDISTMLEEAVHYVKFLQLQIKLLSSDDLWMFAPLAYSGFDIGLPHKFFSQYLKE